MKYLFILVGVLSWFGTGQVWKLPAETASIVTALSAPEWVQTENDTEAAYETNAPLRVVVKELVPFVVLEESSAANRSTTETNFTGFSIELWEEIAQRMEVDYELTQVATVVDQLEAVRNGDADLGIAGISITLERENTLDFSYPIFDAGLQIMTPSGGAINAMHLFGFIMSPALLEIVGVFVVMILIAAHLIWFVERRTNPEFPDGYWVGLWEAIWWASVTVTTVGYGDKTPRGRIGRVIGLAWMFVSLFLVAHFTAGVTTAMTLQSLRGTINSVDDLAGRRVITVEGSTADEFLNQLHLNHIAVENVNEAYAALEAGTVDALVYDSPVLHYYASRDGQGRVTLAGAQFNEEQYGIALPTDSPYREPINQALLHIREDGTYEQLMTKWFGE